VGQSISGAPVEVVFTCFNQSFCVCVSRHTTLLFECQLLKEKSPILGLSVPGNFHSPLVQFYFSYLFLILLLVILLVHVHFSKLFPRNGYICLKNFKGLQEQLHKLYKVNKFIKQYKNKFLELLRWMWAMFLAGLVWISVNFGSHFWFSLSLYLQTKMLLSLSHILVIFVFHILV